MNREVRCGRIAGRGWLRRLGILPLLWVMAWTAGTSFGFGMSGDRAHAAGNLSNRVHEEGRVSCRLLAEVSRIRPGDEFLLALDLKIDPAWHIYWLNPGDSGLATSVKFDLPSGFTQTGEVMFPGPTRIVLPGDIVNYTYKKEVMLFARVKAPTDPAALAALGPAAAFTARAEWLVCKEVCLTGHGVARVSVPIAPGAAPHDPDTQPIKGDLRDGLDINAKSEALFQPFLDRLPRDVSPDELKTKFGLTVQWQGPRAEATLTVISGSAGELGFFPLPRPDVRVDDAASVLYQTKNSAEDKGEDRGYKVGYGEVLTIRARMLIDDSPIRKSGTQVGVLLARIDGQNHYFSINLRDFDE